MSQTYSNLVLESLYSKSLRIDDGGTDADNPLPGQMRFNSTTKKFEGYTGAAGPLGETWRELTSEMAAASTLGGIKVGSNLTINTDTGVMASIASGESRFHQQIITVSKNSGKADYLTIFESNGAIPSFK